MLKTETTEAEINAAYRFGKDQQTRPTIVKIVSLNEKQLVLKQGIQLKNSGIAISHDLTKDDRETKKLLREHLN